MDRTVKSLTNPNILEVVSIGSPLSSGGEISEEWLKASQEDVLKPNGQVFAEIIRSVQKGYPADVKYVFSGLSWGGAMAEATVQELPELQRNIRLLIDSHTSLNHNILQSLQIAAGFLGEGLVRGLTNRKLDITSEAPFLVEYKKLLQQRGMKVDYSLEESKAREQARFAHILQLMKGRETELPNVPTYLRCGVLDPLTFSPAKLYEALRLYVKDEIYKAGLDQHAPGIVVNTHTGSRREFTTRKTHNIDRHDIARWLRHIEQYAQTHVKP